MLHKSINLNTGPVVAIGGGELKDLDTLVIDRAIIKLTGKKSPRALFIGTASNDAVGYFDTFKAVYGKKLGCITDVLSLIKEKPSKKEIENKIFSADLIYVGGGNTLKMLTVWRKHKVDKLLIEAHKKGVVLSGLSAGAICWFKYGLSDSRKFIKNQRREFDFIRIKGLGLLPFIVSPHHIREKKARNPGLNNLIKKTRNIGLAVDDNAAFIVQGNSYKIISSKKKSLVRKVVYKNGEIKKTVTKKTGLLASLLR